MNPITNDIISYLPHKWKEKYTDFLIDEHWTLFIENFNKYLNQVNISQKLPFFDEEVTIPISQIMQYFQSEFEKLNEQNIQKRWSIIIQNSSFDYLLIILGQRITSASVTDETAIPPLKEVLLTSCLQTYNDHTYVVTRSWEKHIGRSNNDFWGEIKGNVNQKNENAKKLVTKLIDNKTWWNVFFHYKQGLVYEIRVESGHGIRWNKEGTNIIGFLEPFINKEEYFKG